MFQLKYSNKSSKVLLKMKALKAVKVSSEESMLKAIKYQLNGKNTDAESR